jgi:hypothetical protein
MVAFGMFLLLVLCGIEILTVESNHKLVLSSREPFALMSWAEVCHVEHQYAIARHLDVDRMSAGDSGSSVYQHIENERFL